MPPVWRQATFRRNYAENDMKQGKAERNLAKTKGLTKDGWFCHAWGDASGNRYAIIGPNGTIYTEFKDATDAHDGKDTTENYYACQRTQADGTICNAIKKARAGSTIGCNNCNNSKQRAPQRSVTSIAFWKQVGEGECVGKDITKRGHSNQQETLLVLEPDENEEYEEYVLANELNKTIWSEKCKYMIFRMYKLSKERSEAIVNSSEYNKVLTKIATVKINLATIKLKEIESAFEECGEKNDSIRADLTILCNSVKDGTPLPQECVYLSKRTTECQQKMLMIQQKMLMESSCHLWVKKLTTSITSDNLNMFEGLFEGKLLDAQGEKLQATLMMIASEAEENDPNTLNREKNTIGGKAVFNHIQDAIKTIEGVYLVQGESLQVDAIHSLMTSGIGDDNDESDNEEFINELVTKISAIALGTDDEQTAKADNKTEDSEMASSHEAEEEEEAEEIVEEVEEAAAKESASVLEELEASDTKIESFAAPTAKADNETEDSEMAEAAVDAPIEPPSDEAVGNVWNCHECTYDNEDANVRRCQMCSEPNPNYKRRKPRRRR